MVLKSADGTYACCANCYYRTIVDTCTMFRYQGAWHCKHWKDDYPYRKPEPNPNSAPVDGVE